MERPWANGLNRLLAERRGLKKGRLAEMADVRPALISAVAHSAQPPQILTLQRIASGFTRYDREFNPKAPDVELWEFFVTDEQAAMLRDRAIRAQAESADNALLTKGAEMFAAFLKQQRSEEQAPPQPAMMAKKKVR